MRTKMVWFLAALLLTAVTGCSKEAVETGTRTTSGAGGENGLQVSITDENVFPAFSQDVRYYVTHCPDGEMSVRSEVSGDLPDGVTHTDGSLRADREVGESVDLGGIEIRCLPDDMPLPVSDGAMDMGGPVLLSTTLDSSSDAYLRGLNPYLMLLDRNGAPVWWRGGPAAEGHAEIRTESGDVFLVSYTEPGESKAVFSHIEGSGYQVELLTENKDGVKLVRERTHTVSGVPLDFHDVFVSRDRVVGLYYKIDKKSRLTGLTKEPDVISIGLGSKDVCEGGDYTKARLAVGAIVFIDKTSSRVVEIAHDGLPLATGALWHTPTGDARDCVIDVDHPNAVDVHEDFYLVTLRHRDSVVAVSEDGEVLWSVGGRRGPHALEIIGDPEGGPVKPHDGRLVGDVLTMFDNRGGVGGARVVSYKIDLQGGTATLVYEGKPVCGDSHCEAFAMGAVRRAGGFYLAAMGTSSDLSVSVLSTETGAQLGSLWFNGYWSYRAVPVDESVLERFRELKVVE